MLSYFYVDNQAISPNYSRLKFFLEQDNCRINDLYYGMRTISNSIADYITVKKASREYVQRFAQRWKTVFLFAASIAKDTE